MVPSMGSQRVKYDLVTEQQLYVISMNLESSPCEIRMELYSSTMEICF